MTRLTRFTVTMDRKVSRDYQTYGISMSETVEVSEDLTEEQVARAKHVCATRMQKQIAHELKAQFGIEAERADAPPPALTMAVAEQKDDWS